MNINIVTRTPSDFISLLVLYKLDEGNWVSNISRRKLYCSKGLQINFLQCIIVPKFQVTE